MAVSRLIRFENSKGQELSGEPQIKHADDLEHLLAANALFALVLSGSGPLSITHRTDVRERVEKLLPVLQPQDVPIIKCVGLNYIKHIQEGRRNPPPYPSIFIKPSAGVAGFNEVIPIPKIAQENQLDYEGELYIVIGKTGKDISKDDVLEHIAGYVVGNDVSARTWQRDPAFAGGVPQWCFSKGFDNFAPLGPLLTWVNGELRQDTETSDLLFGVKEIVSFISQGTTFEKGTVIMTGTPAGVAMGMKVPKYLKDGDVVKVLIDELGAVENIVSFQ